MVIGGFYFDLVGTAIILSPFLILIFIEFRKWTEKKRKIRQEQIKKSNELNEFDENIERLKRLGELYKDGIITKEEFEEKRNQFNL